MIDPNNKLDRTLMFIPGFLTWSMLFMPIWLGLIAPKAAAFILTFISVYWLYMAVKHAKGLWKGYKLYEEALTIDWQQKCIDLEWDKLSNPETLPESYDKTKHFILIPTYHEPYELLEATFESIMNQKYSLNNITVVVGTEEEGEQEISESLRRLRDKFGEKINEYEPLPIYAEHSLNPLPS